MRNKILAVIWLPFFLLCSVFVVPPVLDWLHPPVQASFIGGGGGVSLSGNNTWTGSNTWTQAGDFTAGSSSTPSIQMGIGGAGNGISGSSSVAALFYFLSNGTPYVDFYLPGNQVGMGSAFCLVWYSGASIGSGSVDTQICRGAADGVTVGHISGGGTKPTITAGGCTSPSVSNNSDDFGGGIVIGTSCAAITSITMTFNTAYTNAPFCVINDITTPAQNADLKPSTTAGTLVVTTTLTLLNASDTIWYFCKGN